MKVDVSNYIGKQYGKLKIIEYAGKSKNNNHKFLCRCDCGRITEVLLCNILNGKTKSCGCLKSNLIIKRNTKHNLSYSPLYKIYMGIKNRCYNSKDPNYKKYGEKGITVCDEWLGENGMRKFFDWACKNGFYYEKLQNGKSLLTIDRIDNNKGYSPNNCRWVTNKVQARNKKTSVYIEIDGEKINLRQYAEEHNIQFTTIYKRIKYLKLPVENAIKGVDYRKNNRVIRKPKGDIV